MKHVAADFGGSKGEEMPRWGKTRESPSELDESTGNVFGARQPWVHILMPLCTGCKTLGELTSLKP